MAIGLQKAGAVGPNADVRLTSAIRDPGQPLETMKHGTNAAAGPFLRPYAADQPGWSDQEVRLDEEAAMRPLIGLVQRRQLTTTYQLTDCLHQGRTVRVSSDGIACTVSAWLAELGVHSPLVQDLARTVRDGDWTSAHAIADLLSVDVAVAA